MPARIDDALLLADLRRVARRLRKDGVLMEEYERYGRHGTATIAKRFGGWAHALRAANLKPTREMNVPDAHLLADLKRIARRLRRRVLKMEEYQRYGRYRAGLFFKRFGTWSTALTRVGLKPIRARGVSNEVLLADLQRVARRLRKWTVGRDEYDAHGRFNATLFARRFSGWSKALCRAGLKPFESAMLRIPAASLIADVQRLAQRFGKEAITQDEYAAHGRYNLKTLRRCFGNWATVLRCAGLRPSQNRNVLSAVLLADLRRVARTLRKKAITREQYDACGRYRSAMIAKRFGSWSTALRRVKLRPVRNSNITDAEILADLRRVAGRLHGKSLAQREYRAHGGRYATTTIAKHLGSWPNAILAAKLEVGKLYSIPLADLRLDLQRVARALGKRTLKKDEYDRGGGRYASATIAVRFGSWPDALRAVGLEVVLIRNITNRDLLADLRRVARALGKRTLKKDEYDRGGGRYAGETIARRLGAGSWVQALRVAGLEPGRAVNVPHASLLTDLRQVARALGKRTLTMDEYDARGGRYASATIAAHFGSWLEALRSASLQPTIQQLINGRTGLRLSLRTLASIPGLTTEDRVAVAKTVDGVKDLADEVILQMMRRLNLGPVELPSGIPSGVPFWERCIRALQKVQPDPEKLRATGVLERLGRQLHRAVALELLGREPLSPAEERRVARELQQRKAA